MALTRQVELGSHLASLHLKLIPVEDLAEIWFDLLPHLDAGMAKTDEATSADLLDFILDGSAQLLVEYLDGVPQGCVVTMIINYPRFSALEILDIAGLPGKKMMYPNRHSLELLKQYARLLGCKRLQGFANEAIARLWRRIGFKELSRKVGIDL